MKEQIQESSSSISSSSGIDVYAAGGLIYREISEDKSLEILIIHRPDRDWSFPKGKQDQGETLLQTAIREVEEETGFTCLAEDLIGHVNYLVSDKKLKKEVTYWAMTVETGEFKPNSEVDTIQWVNYEEAKKLLTWDRDKEILDSLIVWYSQRNQQKPPEDLNTQNEYTPPSNMHTTDNPDSDLERIESNLALIEAAMDKAADGDLEAAEDLMSQVKSKAKESSLQ